MNSRNPKSSFVAHKTASNFCFSDDPNCILMTAIDSGFIVFDRSSSLSGVQSLLLCDGFSVANKTKNHRKDLRVIHSLINSRFHLAFWIMWSGIEASPIHKIFDLGNRLPGTQLFASHICSEQKENVRMITAENIFEREQWFTKHTPCVLFLLFPLATKFHSRFIRSKWFSVFREVYFDRRFDGRERWSMSSTWLSRH